MALDRDKFKSLVHYVCWRCEDPDSLGSVKLNKILWLSDFRAYYETQQAITGARYVKRQYGPVPSNIKPVLRELEAEGALSVKEKPFHGYTKTEFVVHRDPDTSRFSAAELGLVERMIQFVLYEHTAKSISEMSHDHIWHTAEEGEEIPYYTIFSNPGKIGDDEREWARLELERLAQGAPEC
jgi:hypothetical protein